MGTAAVLCRKDLIPFKMNYVLEINYLLQVSCLRRVYGLFKRIDKVFRFLQSRERFKLVKELEVLIFLGGLGFSNPCLYSLLLIRDRP